MMKYERYKDSGIEWIGEVPEHWDVDRVKNCVHLITGFPFKSEHYSETGIKLARGINVKEGVFHWGETKFWSRLSPALRPYYLRAGDVLIGMDGSKVGKNYCIVREDDLPILLLQRVARLRAKKNLKPELLYFLIGNTAFKYWVDISKTDPMVPHIAPHDLHNYPIAVPPKSEQTAVADFLQKKTAAIDRKLTLLATKLARYTELSKTLVNEAVCRGLDKSAPLEDSGVEWLGRIPAHWEVRRIGEVFTERVEKVSDTVFQPLSISMNGVVPQMEGTAKTKNGDDRKKVLKGDFVINSRSDRRGASGVSEHDGSVSVISIVLKIGNKLSGRYVHHFFKSHAFTEEFYKCGKGIVDDLWATKYGVMKAIGIPLPPPEEQTAIAAYLDRQTGTIARISTTLKAQMAALKELRKTLINEVVTGKRRVV